MNRYPSPFEFYFVRGVIGVTTVLALLIALGFAKKLDTNPTAWLGLVWTVAMLILLVCGSTLSSTGRGNLLLALGLLMTVAIFTIVAIEPRAACAILDDCAETTTAKFDELSRLAGLLDLAMIAATIWLIARWRRDGS